MIHLTPHMRILLCIDPVDFRCGIDGLARICQQKLASDPFSGCLFGFVNRRRTAIKLLLYDSQGFWLFHKRLSSGRFTWWPGSGDSVCRELAVHELQLLLWSGDPTKARVPDSWKPLEQSSDLPSGVRPRSRRKDGSTRGRAGRASTADGQGTKVGRRYDAPA